MVVCVCVCVWGGRTLTGHLIMRSCKPIDITYSGIYIYIYTHIQTHQYALHKYTIMIQNHDYV